MRVHMCPAYRSQTCESGYSSKLNGLCASNEAPGSIRLNPPYGYSCHYEIMYALYTHHDSL